MTPRRPPSSELPTIAPPRALVLLVRLMLPPDRRDEFLGDLIEQGQRLGQGNHRWSAQRWLWGQILRSVPSLAGARLRALLVPVVSAAAPAPLAPGSGTFASFLGGGTRGGGWRSLSLLAAVALHLLLAVGAIGLAAWKVEELESRRKVSITFNPATMPATAPVPAPSPARQQVRPRPTTGRQPPSQPPSTRPALLPTAPTGGEQPSDGPTVGPDGPGGGQPCPPGASCAEGPAPRMLPPQVGEKRCLACPLPSLPEAYRRMGAAVSLLVRICADASGRTTKVDVLRGLSAEADRKVVEVLAGWRFSTLLLDGRPVPFCYATRFVFTTQ